MRGGCVKLVLVFTAVASSAGAQDGSGSGEEEIYDYGSAYYEEEYEDYHYEEFDHCNLYETEDGEQCSHANFPEKDDIPRGAMRCCDGHRYKYKEASLWD